MIKPMRPSSSVESFRSGAGRLSLDYVRTLRYRGHDRAEEELATPERLQAWIHEFGPCLPSHAAPEPARLASAHELREAIYTMLSTARGPDGTVSCPAAARTAVNAAATQPVPVPQLDDTGGLLHTAPDPITATLALIARDALDLVGSSDSSRLRTCANPDCGILFLDNSRPGTRRWCSMQTCGNQAKKASQRARLE